MTTEEFIQKAKQVHGERYAYSDIEYVSTHRKVKIICPLHGEFYQEPSSHLQGHGCPKCADIENGKKRRKWTNEKCREEAQKYKTKTEFQRGNSGAYLFARKNGLLATFDWFLHVKHPNGYWTKERCELEARKYQSKKDFVKGNPAAHHASVKNGWLDSFDWLIKQKIDIQKDKVDSVYVYVFEKEKVAYVGRTLIRRQKKRDKEHIFNQDDSVARYATQHRIAIPKMKILESNLTLTEGQAREDFWRKYYEQQGYKMLNRIATGIGKSSLGAIGHGKWNRKTCEKEALKYTSLNEFEVNSSGAYAAALRNDWLKYYSWFVTKKRSWDKETCFNEAQKYKTRWDFCKGCKGAYIKSLKMGWINEYTWITSRQTKKPRFWDNYENCYNEAKKHKNRRGFMLGCNAAYAKALKNGWLDDYTWFIEKPKHNYWNKETCYNEALKYSSKKDFKKHANGAYQLAYKKGWLNSYTWFKPLTNFWTYEACQAEASKYRTRSLFKKECAGAYSKSRINGWLDEFFPKKTNKT